jgi:16S rRNA (guanine966-N2)-methyltransferase
MDIRPERIPEFRAAFEAVAQSRLTPDDLIPELDYDLELPLSEATLDLTRLLRHFGPFGIGNPGPVFVSRAVRVLGVPREVGEGHVKLELTQENGRLIAIGFGMAERLREWDVTRTPLDVMFQLQENEIQPMRIIAGKWRSRVIEAPPGRDTRPTADRVREAWMSMLQPDLPESRVLDLFAGSGALGLEALSRGATSATFVERAPPALRVLQANIEKLGALEQSVIIRGDALRFVENLETFEYDLALADPPYGQQLASSLLRLYLERPFAQALWLEHDAAEVLPAGEHTRTRRYGDTAITRIVSVE